MVIGIRGPLLAAPSVVGRLVAMLRFAHVYFRFPGQLTVNGLSLIGVRDKTVLIICPAHCACSLYILRITHSLSSLPSILYHDSF